MTFYDFSGTVTMITDAAMGLGAAAADQSARDGAASAVLRLARDESSHVAGVPLPVDGGYVAR